MRRPWHVWLSIGIVAGISAGAFYVANREGEFEKGEAQTNENNLTVNQLISSQQSNFYSNPLYGVPPEKWGEMSLVNMNVGVPFLNNQIQFIPKLTDQDSVLDFFAEGYIVSLPGKSIIEDGVVLTKSIQTVSGRLNLVEKELKTAESTSTRLTLENYRKSLQGQIEKLKSSRKTRALQRKSAIQKEQDRAENFIRTIAPGAKISKRFAVAINALYVEQLTDAEAAKIKKAGRKIVRNQKVKAVLMDSVPLINADDAWQMQDGAGNSLDGRGTVVAIIDTGIDYTHPDLGGCLGISCKVIGGYDFVNNDSDPMDDYGHGTHVAAIAAGNGALKGVAPGAKILAYKVLNQYGSGSWSSVIAGIDRALDPNQDGDLSDAADVMNLSLGGSGYPDDPPSFAVDNAVRGGSVVVVAAGNSGPRQGTIGSPGTAREAITVGATDKTDNFANFSSRGPVIWNGKSLVKPDLVAPGVNICAAEWDSWLSNLRCLDTRHIAISGTSMAAPHVAGAALLLKQKNPNWTPYDIKSVLRKKSKPFVYYQTIDNGYGRLDVLSAVNSPKLPVAKLNQPQYVAQGILPIVGSANAEKFKEYSIYISNGVESLTSSLSFSNLYTSAAPIDNAKLYSLDTANLGDRYYAIKLVVSDINGNENEDRIVIKVNNFEITSVGDNLNYVSGIAQVKGKILLSGVSQYKIETDNQTILCSKQSLPTSDVLCDIDISSLPNNSYDIRLAVMKDGVWMYDEPFKIAVVHELLSGWPRELNGFPRAQSIVDNLDTDPQAELMVPHYDYCQENWCFGTSIYFFESDGSRKKITFLSNGSRVGMDDLPSIFKDDADNANLIANISGRNGTQIFDKNGVLRYSWLFPPLPFFFNSIAPTTIFSDKLYGSITTWNTGDNKMMHYGFGKTGNVLNGFPITINKEKYNEVLWMGQKIILKQGGENRLAMVGGDYNNTPDDWMNLALYLDIYSQNGALIKRSMLFDDASKAVYPVLSFSASSDLNGDGNSEIVVGYSIVDGVRFTKNVYDINAYKTYIKIFDANGAQSGVYSMAGYMINNIAIGDLGLGKPSIVVTLQDTWPTTSQGQKIIAMDGTGKLIFDKNLSDDNDIVQGLTIGDVDGDAKSEIVISHRPRWWNGMPSGIQIFGSNGIQKGKILLPTLGEVDNFWGMFPVIADFNGDGKTDLVQESMFIPKNKINIEYDTRIYAIGLGGVYNSSEMDWPTFLHDSQHTATYTYIPSIVSGSYQASLDFSSTQGSKNWYYLDGSGASLVYDPTSNRWKGTQTNLALWADGGHPGGTKGAMRRWIAPNDGVVRITGNAKDTDSAAGDGVRVQISYILPTPSSVYIGDILFTVDKIILFDKIIQNGNTTGYNFDLTQSVKAGDKIDFVINPRSNNKNDSTYFDPTITYQ